MAANATDSNTASATSLELQLFSEAEVAATRVAAPRPARVRQTRQPSKAQPTLLNQQSLLLEEPESEEVLETTELELSLPIENTFSSSVESSSQGHSEDQERNVEMTQVLTGAKTSETHSPHEDDEDELSAEYDTSLNDEPEHDEAAFVDHEEAFLTHEDLSASLPSTSPEAKADDVESVSNQEEEIEASSELNTAASLEPELTVQDEVIPVSEVRDDALIEPESSLKEDETPVEESAQLETETVEESHFEEAPSSTESEVAVSDESSRESEPSPEFEESEVEDTALEEVAPSFTKPADEVSQTAETVADDEEVTSSPAKSYVEHAQSSVSLVFPPGIEFFPSPDATIHSKPYPAPEEPVRTTLSQVIGSLPGPAVTSEIGQAPEAEFQAEEEAAPETQPLPHELRHVAAALEKVMHDPILLQGAFANFCGAAYAKPEWAGAASDYLATLFDEQQDLLAEMTRVPDLIIELGAGHYTLTFMVASRWAAKADLARLTRLAEALTAAHAKLNSPEVVDLMLALTTSLAISRYPRAEQLLAAAEAHATEDEQDALNEAHLWLGAGKVVRVCTQEVRDLWDQRLRRPRVAWTWTSREECDALAQVAETLDPNSHAARLFHAVVPACWWTLLVERSQERTQYESALVAAKAGQSRTPFFVEDGPPVAPKEVVRQPIIIWRAIPFFIGGLVGAWALLLGIWLGPFDLVRPTDSGVAPVAVASEESPAASVTTAPPVAPPLAEHPNSVWRKDRIASLQVEVPEMRRLVEQIGMGHWGTYETLLRGETPELPKTEDKYQKLLLWLHLDPPADAEIRRQVPLLLVALRQDSTVIDLWQKLVYPGSLNADEIQSAALRTLHDNVESWSASQRKALGDLAKASVVVVPQ